MALIYGVGFPPFKGGVFRWLDSIGLDQFVALSDKYKHLGTLYEATEKQRAMAKAGETYYR